MRNWISCLIGLCYIPGVSSHAQDNTLEENVYATVSEEYLMPGEKMWIHIYASHLDTPTPSKVAYMELLNRDNVPVVQEMTELTTGHGNGYLTIPDDLPSDYYLLRIYTRNSPLYSPETGVYHQLIGIINPDVPPISSSKPVNPSFFLAQTENTSAKNEEFFQYNLDDEQLKLKLVGEPTDRITVALSYSGQFPPIPSLDESKLYESSPRSKNYIPEIFSHIIHGRSLERIIDTTETFFLSAHGLDSKLLISKSQPNGNVFFETGGFSHYDYIIIQSTSNKDQLNFVVESSFWQQKPTPQFVIPYLEMSNYPLNLLEERMIASQASAYFQSWTPQPIPSNPRLFLPDNVYLLDDYNRFDDMATVVREYVPEVLVRREEKQTVFRNVNRPAEQVFKENPLILIDALPILDSEAFSKFDPVGIRQMDILNRQLYLNHELFEGAIALTSFDNDFGKFDLPKNALFIEYKGIQFPLSPNKLEADERHLSELGSLLLWKNLTLEGESEDLTLALPQLKGNYKLKITNWDNITEPNAQIEKTIEIE